MISEQATYDELKLSIFTVLDYNAVLSAVNKYIGFANHDKCVLQFRGEDAHRGLAVLWFDYLFITMLPVAGVRGVFEHMAERMRSRLAEFHTETGPVVSANAKIDLSREEMRALHQTRAGQVGWETDCPTDYVPLLLYKPTGSPVETMRVNLVVSLLEAQKAQARKAGKNEHANFAAESINAVLGLKVPVQTEVEMEPDPEDDPLGPY